MTVEYISTETVKDQPSEPIIDFNTIFKSKQLKKDYTKLANSPKKISFIFVIGLEGTGHHWMATFFDTVLKNTLYQANYAVMDGIMIEAMAHCFAYEQYKIHPEPDNDPDLYPNNINTSDNSYKEYLALSSCDAVTKRFNYYSSFMMNNSILFHSGHSYPYGIFWDPDRLNWVNRYPDIIRIIHWAQNAQPYPFDVRIIYLHRKFTNAVLSTMRRFTDKQERIQLFTHSLNMVQQQLMSIDDQFWIGIDLEDMYLKYGHFELDGYIDIFCRFLGPYLTVKDVGDAIKTLVTGKQVSHNYAKKQWKGLMSFEQWSVLEGILRHKSKKWPLLLSPDILVTPDNMKFLLDKPYAVCRPPAKW